MISSNIPPVSVVIPTLNEERYLPQLLSSLLHLETPLEIIVVDGGSSDGTRTVVEMHAAECDSDTTLTFIESGQAKISIQRNISATRATHEVILFCDADVIAPNAKMFSDLVTDFLHHQYVVAGVRFVPDSKSFVVRSLFTIFYTLQRLLLLFGKVYLAGAFMLTTREAHQAIGGFDENLRVSEDVDYSHRASNHGKACLYSTKIQVSARRFKKYGYSWIFKNPRAMLALLFKGKITTGDEAYYPFGEY